MFNTLKEITDRCKSDGKEFWQIILEDDMSDRNVDKEDSMSKMKELWDAMYHASVNYDGDIKSSSGLSGGDGKKMEEYTKTHDCLCGDFMGRVIVEALKMGESNACMRRIVAAPTAGACGVLPAILVPYYDSLLKNENKEQDVAEAEEKIIKALYVAAGIGGVIAKRASISGAKGGCQAEIGSASAMSAGALTYLHGLVCDPVAGLVEVPCIKRNVGGAVNAVSCSQMALAGIESRVPADEVIDAMAYVGDKMDETLRETGIGGLAGTPFGKKVADEIL